jgi:hypothetical protein
VHKHQLCDKIAHCAHEGDESGELCNEMTDKKCKRRYVNGSTLGQLKPFPIAWINDGLEDCWNGEDENKDWPTCGAGRTTRYKRHKDPCTEVFLCNHAEDFVEFSQLCDRVDSCMDENKICIISRNQSKIFSKGLRDFQGTVSLSYCQKGLKNIGNLNGKLCGKYKLVLPSMNEVFGKNSSTEINLPLARLECNNMYGEIYVYTSCLGHCINTTCPLHMSRHLRFDSCPGQFTRNLVKTVDANGNMTILIKDKRNNVFGNEVFQCTNGKCLNYDKVCNLVDDCGDSSDEKMCSNHVQCEGSREYFQIHQKCDAIFHCFDKSDECNETCGRQILSNIFLKVTAWIIGILAIVLNCKVIVKGGQTLVTCRTDAAFCTNCLVILIALGDFLVGAYLTVLSSFDAYHGSGYCLKQLEWLTSNTCLGLGITCTLGSQISLFSMTALSLLRSFGTKSELEVPREVNVMSYVKAGFMCSTTLLFSLIISILPTLHVLEDLFVNGLTYDSSNTLFIGSLDKEQLMNILEQYYGRMPLEQSLRWRQLEKLVREMFSQDYDGIMQRTLTFYGNDPVCVFKYFIKPNDPQRDFVLLILVLNFCCFVVIAAAYGIIRETSRKSIQAIQKTGNCVDGTITDTHARLQRVTKAIIFTDFLCWVPFIVMCFLHFSGAIDATSWYSYFTILVLPINCVVNPILYDTTAIKCIHVKLEKNLSNLGTLVKVKNRKKRSEEMMPSRKPVQSGYNEQYEMQSIHSDKVENKEKNSDNTGEITSGLESIDENLKFPNVEVP